MRVTEEPLRYSSPPLIGLASGQWFRPSPGAAMMDSRSEYSEYSDPEELKPMASPDQERLNRIRQSLADGGLDALLLLYPDDILMATGMLPASTHVAVLVDRDGRVSLPDPLVAGILRGRGELGRPHRLLRLVQAGLRRGPRPGCHRVAWNPEV